MRFKKLKKKNLSNSIRINLLLFLILSVFLLIIVPVSATNNYTGNSSNCKSCHEAEYALWANTTHTSKLITRDDAQARGYPTPPGGYDWANVSFVIGSKWKIRYVNDTGYIITNGGKNQFNVDDQVWTDYNKDTVKKYNCGHCHATGYLSNVTDTVKEPFRTLRNQGQIPDGVYDNSSTPGFKGYWAENSVGCEACHGPGEEHVNSPSTLNIRNASVVLNTPEICGDCHNRGKSSKYGEYDNFKPYPYGANDSLLNETLYDDSPMPTVNYSLTGGHHEQWEDLKASGHAGNSVNCANCHGGHAVSDPAYAGGPTGKIKFNNGSVYPAAVNRTCTSCHALELPKHGKYSANSECITCHMPKNRKSSNKVDLRSHWFDITALRDNKNTGIHTVNNPDLSIVPQSCETCHRATPGNFTGNSSSCGVCHKEQYALWANTTHTSKLITRDDAQARDYPTPPGGYDWADVSFVIGSKWKIRYVNDTGYIITNGGKNQFNVDDQVWTDYNKDTVKKYNCGHCHATGYLSSVNDTVKEPFRTLRNQGQLPDGVYDNSQTPGFKGYWAENSVGCEACHGNGGDHVLSPSKLNIRNASVVRNTPEICGDCHSRAQASKYGEYDNFKPYPDGVNDSLLNETLYDDSPMPTVNYSLTGGHHEQWEDMKASVHANNSVSCVSCHNSHAVSNPAYAGGPTGKIKFNNGTVYPAAVTQTCTSCHALELPKHGYYTQNSECISCHMPQNRKSSNKIDLRSHWFNPNAMKNNKNTGVHARSFMALRDINESCVKCHGWANLSKQINAEMVGNHKNVNVSEGSGLLNSSDCKTCHYGATSSAILNLNCQDCHTTAGTGPVKPTNPALIKDGLQHGVIDCQWCHTAGSNYHISGPKGTAAGADCSTCHVSANLQDAPFFAPGETHESNINLCGDCHSPADNHAVGPNNAGTPPSVSLSPITTVASGTPALVQATITDDNTMIAGAQYRVTNTSGQVIPWTNMTPNGGRYDSSSKGVTASIATSSLKGTYTVEVKGMASAPRTNGSIPYYPLNGQWSSVSATPLTVNEVKGYINGTVRDKGTGDALAGVTVSTTGVSGVTDGSGNYSLAVPTGTYGLVASYDIRYYTNSSVTVPIVAPDIVLQDIELELKPTGNISGIVSG